jgi:hypothetical protein
MKLGECMDGQVGLLEKPETSHSTRIRKLVPDTLPQGFQVHSGDDALKEVDQGLLVTQRFLRTPINFQQPFHACQRYLLMGPVSCKGFVQNSRAGYIKRILTNEPGRVKESPLTLISPHPPGAGYRDSASAWQFSI